MDVVAGLESDLEEAKAVMRSSSNAHASAAKALLRLQSARENYINIIEQARRAKGRFTSPLRAGDETSNDLLSPFLLLLSHKEVPSVGVCASLSGVQRLIQAGLVQNNDGESICHMLEMLSVRRESTVDFKVLQTCSILAASPVRVSAEVLHRVVGIITAIADEDRTKDLSVRKAAIGCLTQVSLSVFENIASVTSGEDVTEHVETARCLFEELCSVPERNDTTSAAKAGFGLIRGIAFLAGGSKAGATASRATSMTNRKEGAGRAPSIPSSDGPWIEPNRICNRDALEVLDTLLSDHSALFVKYPQLGVAVPEKCGPTVLSLIRGKFRESTTSGGYGWPLMVRLMRTTKSLIHLRSVCGTQLTLSLFTELVAMLETENSELIVTPTWHYILTLETVLATFQDPGFLQFLFSNSIPITIRSIESLNKIIQSWTSSPNHSWALIDEVAREAELSSRGDASDTRRTRSRGLDLLTDAEPPANFDGPVVVLVATECIVAALADGGLKHTPTVRVGGLLRRSTSLPSSLPEEAMDDNLRKSVLEVTWKPCLNAFTCLLAGCHEEGMVQYLLRGYLSLTMSCGSAKLVEARDAFITTMCRYALPDNFASHSSALTSFQSPIETRPSLSSQTGAGSSQPGSGVITADRLLTHKHLQLLKTLFNVAHGLGSILGTSWHIVLETFEQLDLVLHVQHAQRNLARKALGESVEDSVNGAMTQQQQLEELEDEEIDAETKMIESMLKNLFETSKYLDDDAVLHMVIALSQMIFTNLAHASTVVAGPTIGSPGLVRSHSSSSIHAKEGHSLPRRFLENLTQSIKTALIAPASPTFHPSSSQLQLSALLDSDELRFPPFALDKLVETAELNLDRIKSIWEVVGSTLLTVASSENDVKLRAYAVKAMERLVTKVVMKQDDQTVRRDVVRKFTELARSPHTATKDATLQALYRFVSSAGHRLEGIWNLIVAELLIISTTQQTSKQTSALAFKVVQLVMDDYRPSLDMGCLPSLALCLRAFGEQQNDVNMALTSVHHLWLLCEKGDESLEFPAGESQPTKESLLKANALWLHVFDQLKGLSLDPRMEVRNSALRSLCTNIVACGDRLTVSSWKICALDIMLPLVDAVDSKAFAANASDHVLGERLSSHSEMRMTLHHSQDTEEKQWRETRVTAMQGTGKVVASIMNKMENYNQLEWFKEVWARTLAFIERALQTATPARDVVLAAVSVFEELTLLVCGAKSRTKYAVPGMRVVNGALVREEPPESDDSEPREPSTKKTRPPTSTSHLWLWPSILQVVQRLYERDSPPPFDGDVAALFINIFAELLENKECTVVRTQDALRMLLSLCKTWTSHFSKSKNSNKFVSPLERNVLKLYSRLAPLNDDETWVKVVFGELHKLGGDAFDLDSPVNNSKNSGSVTTAVFDEDDFKNKVRLVYSELYSQAPDSVKSGYLKEALIRSAKMSEQTVAQGLESLPTSGLLDQDCEDVWMQVLERVHSDSSVTNVIMKESIGLLRRGRVPTAMRESLLRTIEKEITSPDAPFERKLDMVNALIEAVSATGGDDATTQIAELIPTFLICSSDILIHYEHPLFLSCLTKLVNLEIEPKDIAATTRTISEAAYSAATQKVFRKSHLLHLLSQLEHIAGCSPDMQVRCVAAKALGSVALEGWRS